MDFLRVSELGNDVVSNYLLKAGITFMQMLTLNPSSVLNIVFEYLILYRKDLQNFFQKITAKHPNLNTRLVGIVNWLIKVTPENVYQGFLKNDQFTSALNEISQVIFAKYEMKTNYNNLFQGLYKLLTILNVGCKIIKVGNQNEVTVQSINKDFTIYFLSYSGSLFVLIPESLDKVKILAYETQKWLFYHCSHFIPINDGTSIAPASGKCNQCNQFLYNEDKNLYIKQKFGNKARDMCGKCYQSTEKSILCPDCEWFLCRKCFNSSNGFGKCPLCNFINVKSLFFQDNAKEYIKDKRGRNNINALAVTNMHEKEKKILIGYPAQGTNETYSKADVNYQEYNRANNFANNKCSKCENYSQCSNCGELSLNFNKIKKLCQRCEQDLIWKCQCGHNKRIRTSFCTNCNMLSATQDSEQNHIADINTTIANSIKKCSTCKKKPVCFSSKCQQCNVCDQCKNNPISTVCEECLVDQIQTRNLINPSPSDLKPGSTLIPCFSLTCTQKNCKFPALITCLSCRDSHLCGTHAPNHLNVHKNSFVSEDKNIFYQFTKDRYRINLNKIEQKRSKVLEIYQKFIAETEKSLNEALNHFDEMLNQLKGLDVYNLHENSSNMKLTDEFRYEYIVLREPDKESEIKSWVENFKELCIAFQDLYLSDRIQKYESRMDPNDDPGIFWELEKLKATGRI